MSLGLEFVVRRDAEVSDRIRELPQRGSERKTDRPEGQQRGREAARLAGSHQHAQDQAEVVGGGPQWVPDLHLVHSTHRHAATAAGLAQVSERAFDHFAASSKAVLCESGLSCQRRSPWTFGSENVVAMS